MCVLLISLSCVGQIVDLGCGWGSLTLFLAEKYPNSSITSISNSASQKAYIDGQCKVRVRACVRVLCTDSETEGGSCSGEGSGWSAGVIFSFKLDPAADARMHGIDGQQKGRKAR